MSRVKEGTQLNTAVVDWLLDSDPSIRWQVMQDLMGEAADIVTAERSRVASEGWGAKLLALQDSDGNWDGGPWVRQSWASTMETLMLLREMGIEPTDPNVKKALDQVCEKSNWGPYHGNAPFFDGESEPCINGRVLACGAYFNRASDTLVDRLLDQQLEDGGWNCDAPPSQRSSFNSTICMLEGLLEYEKSTNGATERRKSVRAARLRGEEYLLERHLFKSLSTGQVIPLDRKGKSDWRAFAFPNRWHYDVLWGLDYLRRAGAARDDRLTDALDLVIEKRGDNGQWALDLFHEGKEHFPTEGGPGTSSRWVTLRALRVLDYFRN